jgi:hypothetical protein
MPYELAFKKAGLTSKACKDLIRSALSSCANFIAGKYVLAVAPLCEGLIVNVDIRLWKEGLKQLCEAQLGSSVPRIGAATRAPEIECSTISMKLAHAFNGSRNGDPFGADRSDQSVVYVHKNNALFHFRLLLTLGAARFSWG